MNKIKAFIPNALTLGNLLCGCVAIYFIFQSKDSQGFLNTLNINTAATFIFIALVLDFLDGFVARLLKVDGELGKQLDSLADVVSFGVVPGFMLLLAFQYQNVEATDTEALNFIGGKINVFNFAALLIPIAAAYRLAKFNIDSEQSENFKGLATPAMAIFVFGLYYLSLSLKVINHPLLIALISIALSYLMVSNIPMFSLKFKSFTLKDNWFRYALILSSVVLLIWLKVAAFAIIIPFYILLSLTARKSFR